MKVKRAAVAFVCASASLASASTPVVRQEAPSGYFFLSGSSGQEPGSQGQFFTLRGAGGPNQTEVFRASVTGWQRVSPPSSVQRRYAVVDTDSDGVRALIATLDPALPVGGLVWDATTGLSAIQTPSNISNFAPGGWSADGQVITGRGVDAGVGLSATTRTASGQWRVNSASFSYFSPNPAGTLASGTYRATDGQQWPAAWNLTNDTIAVAVPPLPGQQLAAGGSLNRLHNVFGVSTLAQGSIAGRNFVYFANSGQYVPLQAPAGFVGAGAQSASGDASLILGVTSSPSAPLTPLVFAWTPTTGSLLLQDYLARFGVDFSGWASLETARVSLDGLTFWGLGQYQTAPGQTSRQAWTVTIPAPPAAPALFAAGLLACRRRRR